MNEEIINKAILTLEVLIDCAKEDGTYYNAKKEWEALEVFKQLQQENQQLKDRIDKAIQYIDKHIRIDDEYPMYMEMLIEERDELLEILKGENNE